MIFIYTLYNAVCAFLGHKIYKKIINPILLYVVVWQVALTFHQSGLILYYPLQRFTWITIFVFQTLFMIGCLIGKILANKYSNSHQELLVEIEAESAKKLIKIFIIATTILASVGIIGNTLIYMRHYGFNLFSKMTQIYYDRVNNLVSLPNIPYLNCFLFVSFALAGVYLKKYGFTYLIIPLLPLLLLLGLISAARADMVFSLLFLVIPYVVTENKRDKKVGALQILKKVIPIAIMAVLILVAILLFTGKRSGSIEHASPAFYSIFGENVVVYKTISYIASPIGTLNEYLKTCEFNFGQNTFLPLYNILSKLGIIGRIEQYQEFYNTPIACNVGTWYRELIEDFTYIGGEVSVLIFAFLASYTFSMSKNAGELKCKFLFSFLGGVILLSFFDWKIRSATIIIPMVCSFIIGWYIERRIKKKNALKYQEESVEKS